MQRRKALLSALMGAAASLVPDKVAKALAAPPSLPAPSGMGLGLMHPPGELPGNLEDYVRLPAQWKPAFSMADSRVLGQFVVDLPRTEPRGLVVDQTGKMVAEGPLVPAGIAQDASTGKWYGTSLRGTFNIPAGTVVHGVILTKGDGSTPEYTSVQETFGSCGTLQVTMPFTDGPEVPPPPPPPPFVPDEEDEHLDEDGLPYHAEIEGEEDS